MRGTNRSLIVAGAARTLAVMLARGGTISRHMRRNFGHIFSHAGIPQSEGSHAKVRGPGHQSGALDLKALRWFGVRVRPEKLNIKGPRPAFTYRAARRNLARKLGLLGA